jgi:microcystin-dependent protein
MPSTPRLHLPYPADTDPADAPHDVGALAQALDGGVGVPSAAFDSQGTLSQLPAPGTPGRYFWATDQGTLYRDDGAVWRPMGPQPGDFKHSGAGAAYGWVLCDGSALPRAGVNAALFAAIGITWGAGDGSTTFNVPEQRGRVLVGAGAGPGLTNRANGAKGGEENHTLAAAEMPSHAHSVYDPGHAHSISDPTHVHGVGHLVNLAQGSGAQYTLQGTGGDYISSANPTGIGIYGSATGISLYGAGGDAPHNNIPPYGAANVFIKL